MSDPKARPPRPSPLPWREVFTARVVLMAAIIGQFASFFLARAADRGGASGTFLSFLAGGVIGFLGPLLVRHPYRVGGLVPVFLMLWAATLGLSLLVGGFAGGLIGFAAGGTLTSAVRFVAPYHQTEGRWMAVTGLVGGLGFIGADACGISPAHMQPWLGPVVFVSASVLGLFSLRAFARPLVELVLDLLFWRGYRTRGVGPGIAAFPMDRPVLVIANHACYLDPVFLGRVLPRPVTAMMTATFFDKPIIRPLMVHVFGTIRVSEDPIKRDATELREAIAALDRGRCLLIFPEGYLRRKDDVPLRRFGRGVWEVLRAHPDTPVVACWIEGAWGSRFSFKDGPPGGDKPKDRARPIGVGVSAPETVPPDVLADHLSTRLHLMNLVLGARTHLGLPDLPPVELPKRGERPADDAA